MSENLNRGSRDFSKYDTMETAELEEILRLDATLPEGAESDTELLLYVMGVLADRRKNNGVSSKTAFEAWESFEKNYMPGEEECEEPSEKKNRIVLAPWMRRAIAAAAVLALLVCLPLSANALGLEDLWNIIARWAKETFSFVSGEDTDYSEPTPDSREEFTSLQDALIKSNRDPSIVPTWIPEGYLFDSVTKDVTPMREIYIGMYTKGSEALKLLIKSYIDTDPAHIEINDSLIEIYHIHGTDYYIFNNMDNVQAIWIYDTYECTLSGHLSLEEIKQIINSINVE